MSTRGSYRVVTDGRVFRIQQIYFGDRQFVGIPDALEFSSKEAAEKYIHEKLSDAGWQPA